MMPRALSRLVCCLLVAGAYVPAAEAQLAMSPKVLRYAFRVAETGFDPPQVSDLYSRNVMGNIFDAPYSYAFLARPVRLKPNTAAGLPEFSADMKTMTVRIRPGIYFADDPAFKGQRRELVAQDYVYSLKRMFDPRWKSSHLSNYQDYQLLGLDELRREALAGKPFDYDREVEGVRAIDRYTIQFKLGVASPRFADELADNSVMGAVAREVVELYGDRIMEHPVGTGAFKLAEWRRSSRIVLVRNESFRDEYHDEDPPPDDPVAVRAAQMLKGRKLPMIDRVEVSIIEAAQPRYLAFVNGETDIIEQVPEDFTYLAIPNDKIAPNLAKRGIYEVRYQRADLSYMYFNMEHPVVGGYTADRVALRRAIGLAIDTRREIRIARRGQALVAHSTMAPNAYGYDPDFRSEMGTYDPARAKALLDLYGYVDRNGDGWRDLPDGSPLVLHYATENDDFRRQLAELYQKNMNAIGIRIEFRVAQWPENLKAARAGRLMMWGLGWSAGPDGDGFLTLLYGPGKGQYNTSRFDLAEFNRLYELQKRLPNGPERLAAMDQAKRLVVAYMPVKVTAHRIWTDLAHPWVVGYHRNQYVRDWWRLIDIDTAELARQNSL